MTRQTKRMKFSGCKKFPIISSTTQKKSNLENSFNIQYAIKYSIYYLLYHLIKENDFFFKSLNEQLDCRLALAKNNTE